jgi:hypothetical protein
MTCFIVLYLIYVIYYACRFEKLLRAYVVLLSCVLSVIRFQDGGRRSAGGLVPKLESDILRRNASTNVQNQNQIKKFYLKSVHFITIQHKLSRAFQTERT